MKKFLFIMVFLISSASLSGCSSHNIKPVGLNKFNGENANWQASLSESYKTNLKNNIQMNKNYQLFKTEKIQIKYIGKNPIQSKKIQICCMAHNNHYRVIEWLPGEPVLLDKANKYSYSGKSVYIAGAIPETDKSTLIDLINQNTLANEDILDLCIMFNDGQQNNLTLKKLD